MKIAHFSDTHGLPRKPVPAGVDAIVLSGDICPNAPRKREGSEARMLRRALGDVLPRTPMNPSAERLYQTGWLRATGAAWKRWAGDTPVLLVEGNHDYVDPAPILREFKVRATNLEGREVFVHGLKFMGLPDVPWMGGEMNHERWEPEIKAHVELILERRPDVLVSHSPMYGVLDMPYAGYHIGSTALGMALSLSEHRPIALLHGHCHEQGSQTREVMEMIVSNAACGRRVVDVARR